VRGDLARREHADAALRERGDVGLAQEHLVADAGVHHDEMRPLPRITRREAQRRSGRGLGI